MKYIRFLWGVIVVEKIIWVGTFTIILNLLILITSLFYYRKHRSIKEQLFDKYINKARYDFNKAEIDKYYNKYSSEQLGNIYERYKRDTSNDVSLKKLEVYAGKIYRMKYIEYLFRIRDEEDYKNESY